MSEYVTMPSGLIVPESVAERTIRAKAEIFTGISLFSGCGGMDLGFVQAGCHVVAAVEHDCSAVHTYMANLCRWDAFKLHFITETDRKRFEKYLEGVYRDCGLKVGKNGHIVQDGKVKLTDYPRAGMGWISQHPEERGTEHVFFGDIRKLKTQRVLDAIGMKRGEVGCVFGGPPCQGYSHAGKRNVMDPRNSLVFEWARFVVEINPQTCIMENVPGIATMVTEAGVPVLDELCLILEKGSFGARNAFRKSIEAQLGIALVRGKPIKNDAPDGDEGDDAPSQSDMFSMATE